MRKGIRGVTVSTTFKALGLPDGPRLEAAGMVLIRHGQLEHMLRMLVKTLLGASTREALDATEGMRTSDVREKIRKLVRQGVRDEALKSRVDSLLNRAKRATERRSELIHVAWVGEGADGSFVKNEDHEWIEAPSVGQLRSLAAEIEAVTREIVHARSEDGWLVVALDQAARAQPIRGG